MREYASVIGVSAPSHAIPQTLIFTTIALTFGMVMIEGQVDLLIENEVMQSTHGRHVTRYRNMDA